MNTESKMMWKDILVT